MADHPFNILSLCSGIGGLDLAVHLAVPSARTVCWVEWEAYCVEVLGARMEEGALAPAPVWSNLKTFDGTPWRGVVDCVTAGYPCQPFSVAGKRRGEDDPRHLWPHVARILREVRPRFAFLENVSGHVALGLDTVLRELRDMGYRTATTLCTAAEVGASHRRERLFVLAYSEDCPANGNGNSERDGEIFEGNGKRLWTESSDSRRAAVADAQRPEPRAGEQGQQGDSAKQRGNRPTDDNAAVADAPQRGVQGVRPGGEQEPQTSAGQEVPRCDGAVLPPFPPGPGQLDQWRRILEVYPWLEPAMADPGSVERQPHCGEEGEPKMAGGEQHAPGSGEPRHADESAPSLEPALCLLADGLPDWMGSCRPQRLRAYGNSVLALQAAYALTQLVAKLEQGDMT